MSETAFRIIHTNLFSQLAKDVLTSLFKSMTVDTYGDSRANEKYWRFANVARTENGEVVIIIDTATSICCDSRKIKNGFAGLENVDVPFILAKKLKTFVKSELNRLAIPAGWSRSSTHILHCIDHTADVSVAEVYCIYDHLNCRETFSKYDMKLLNSVFGKSTYSSESDIELQRKAKLYELQLDWTNATNKLKAEMFCKINKIKADYDKRLKKLDIEFTNRRNAIESK